MSDIPKYLSVSDEEVFSRWQRFANFAKAHDSIYLSRDERELMTLDLYQVERGYAEGEEDFESARKIYAPFLEQVLSKLSRLVMLKNREYNWERIINDFAHRRAGEDFAEIIAHDILLIEKANELYRELKSGKIALGEKFDTSLEETAFKVARLIEEKDHENYMV